MPSASRTVLAPPSVPTTYCAEMVSVLPPDRHGGDHAVRVFLKRNEFRLVTQRHVRERPREPRQDRVEHVLRHALALLRALRRAGLEAAAGKRLAAKLIAVERGEIDVVLRIVGRVGRVPHPVDDAPAAAEFHRPHADEVHLRLLDRAVGLLDQCAGHAAPAEVAGERQTDRPAADDQHRHALSHLYLRSSAWKRSMSTSRWRSAKVASRSCLSPMLPVAFRCASARCMPSTAACNAVLA